MELLYSWVDMVFANPVTKRWHHADVACSVNDWDFVSSSTWCYQPETGFTLALNCYESLKYFVNMACVVQPLILYLNLW